jgi:hypothetical protein
MGVISTAVPNYEIDMITDNPQSVLTCHFKVKKTANLAVGRTTPYTFDVMINKSPTGNCQLTSLAYVNYLLTNTQNNANDVKAILTECFKMAKHACKLALVDVNEQYIPGVESCFNVMTKQPYVSTNGSKMCHFLIKFSG